MAIGDIVFSISQAHFNAATPKDLNYAVWNAIGNRYTCSARGFFASVGVIASAFYIASLNLYSLATVKYQKDDRYIKKYIEPFLHAVPWGWALIYSVVTLILEGFNDAGGGNCIATQYKAPHCKGYEKGEVREGFTIPCLRGTHGGFPRLALYISFLVVPIVSGVSLVMIYYSVKKMERAMRRYSTMNQQSNSRKVMGKAFSFTIAYLVTFVPWLVGLGYGGLDKGELRGQKF
jgi:arginine exporter protein ArgO